MLVSRVSPVSNANIVPAKVSTRRTLSSPVFGTVLKKPTADLVKNILPHCEREAFGDRMISAALDSSDPHGATEKVYFDMVQAARRLRKILLGRGEVPPPVKHVIPDKAA